MYCIIWAIWRHLSTSVKTANCSLVARIIYYSLLKGVIEYIVSPLIVYGVYIRVKKLAVLVHQMTIVIYDLTNSAMCAHVNHLVPPIRTTPWGHVVRQPGWFIHNILILG